MWTERGYYRSAYSTDTDSTQRGNSCSSLGTTEDTTCYTKLLSLTVSPTLPQYQLPFLPFQSDSAPVCVQLWILWHKLAWTYPSNHKQPTKLMQMILWEKISFLANYNWSIKTDFDFEINSVGNGQMSSTPVTAVSLRHSLFRGGQNLGSLCVGTRRMATCSHSVQ